MREVLRRVSVSGNTLAVCLAAAEQVFIALALTTTMMMKTLLTLTVALLRVLGIN